MYCLENCIYATSDVQHIAYSRYIVSWRNSGGQYFDEFFEEFLKNNGCTKKEIHDIVELATCGKLELEMDAKKFIKKEKEFLKQFEDEE